MSEVVLPGEGETTLVVGSRGHLSDRVVRGLLARGARVRFLGVTFGEAWSMGDASPASGAAAVGDVQVLSGDPGAIDFGLSGAEYTALSAEVTAIVVCFDGPGEAASIEQSLWVRVAREAVELVASAQNSVRVVSLSSLLVLGNALHLVKEEELQVGQGFSSREEEAMALAERILREGLSRLRVGELTDVSRVRSLSVLRTAPISGDVERGELLVSSPLARLARQIQLWPAATDVQFSERQVRFETSDRAAAAILKLWEAATEGTFHLMDETVVTDRQLAEFLAKRAGTRFSEAGPGRGRRLLRDSDVVGARTVTGWTLRSSRQNAEATLGSLLEVDPKEVLQALFPLASSDSADASPELGIG